MDNLTNIVKKTDTGLNASKSDTMPMDANDDSSIQATSDIQCYDWLDILSQMNKQFFMVVSKDLQVEFISQYTLDFFELGNELSAIPDDLSYKQIIAFMVQKGYMGKADVKRIIKAINVKNQSHLTENNEVISENDGLNIITPSGRHINLQQRHTKNDQILVFGNDITQDYIDNHALKLALDSSQSGYGIYHMDTRKFSIYGDLLSTHFDKEMVDNLTLESLSEIIHPNDRDKCRAAWYEGLDTHKSWRIQFRLMGPDNRNIWIKGHYTPQKSEDGVVTHVICFFSDISYVIRAQSELLQISEQQKETLKAKTDFISRLSHEIRTPMNAVIGIADALVHDNADTADIDKLELIQSSAENILKILDETLQHSKLEERKVELNPRPASPVKSIETLCELWEDKAKKTQTQLSCQIDPAVPKSMFFDDFRFEQCLNNLISNAIKFAAGGNIKIVQTITEKDDKKYLITAVKDDGIGMTDKTSPQKTDFWIKTKNCCRTKNSMA